jgi:hypothetical protein
LGVELHIHIHQDTEDVTDIIANFPFENGQKIAAQSEQLVIIDLAEADDTSYVQEWYLNGHEGVASFYIVDDDPGANLIYPEE